MEYDIRWCICGVGDAKLSKFVAEGVEKKRGEKIETLLKEGSKVIKGKKAKKFNF